jgi:uncharacterized YccA/Bax inhibitor family protein
VANPILSQKGFERGLSESDAGWAAPDAAMAAQGQGPAARAGERTMTANGTFGRTAFLFVLVLIGGAIGWSQTNVSPAGNIEIPAWSWVALFAAFAVAMVCAFVPKTSPFLSPVYAILEGVFLGVISKAFESQWDGIVFQAILATVGVFFVTLILYVTKVVKVTRRFQMVVIGATLGIFVMYVMGALLSVFGVDVVFWNQPTTLGIVITVVIACVAALNLFLDYEFIRQATLSGAPKFMEWYGAFGIMVTLVWLYIEMLRLLALLRQ